jgi:disulfide bond formation protein DsbB
MLGLSMPGWVLIACICLGLAGLLGNWLIDRTPARESALKGLA